MQYNHNLPFDLDLLTLENILSRIINPESAGKERIQLSKGVVLAIRELAQQTGPGPESRDLAAFIAIALIKISETIEISVAAWEKRDYWVKADKFRMDWAWAGQYGERMSLAVLGENWDSVTQLASKAAQKLSKITVPAGHRLGRPWVGAYTELERNKNSPG
jgi:hypothetical protein